MALPNIPFWVYAALAAGACGALGALIGFLLEKLGLKWGRWVGVLGIVVGLGVIRSDAFSESIQRMTYSNASVEAQLTSIAPELYSYLKSAFPQEYEDLIQGTADAVRTAGLEGSIERRSAEAMATLRQKYAPFIKFASDAELSNLLSAQMTFFDTLNQDDAVVCAQVAMNGAMSQLNTGFSQTYAKDMATPTLAMFKAIRNGMDAPLARRQPTDDDWAYLSGEMRAAGAPESYFTAIATPDPKNTDLCPALIMLMRVMNLPDERAGIVRAAFLSESASS